MLRSLCLVAFVSLSMAQLPEPNGAGVASGHLHLNVKDVDSAKKLFIDALGGKPALLGKTDMAKFPNVLVVFTRRESAGSSVGSSVNHIGFIVKDLEATVDKVRAAGFQIEAQRPSPTQVMVRSSDDLRIELTGDPSISAPIMNHHIHFMTAAADDIRAWYAKMFGAVPGMRGRFKAADVPGVNLSFSETKEAVAPTKGRALDHIGFEVTGLEAFCKRLEAEGVKFDVPYRKVPAINSAIAFFTDPWGVYVELTEGLRLF